jgi:hypothetical protein
MFKDKEFANQWFKYHLENAKLRPLCKSCNLTRKKRICKKSHKNTIRILIRLYVQYN